MSLKFSRTLVRGALVIIFWSVGAKAALAQSASLPPYLSLKFGKESTPKGKLPSNRVSFKRDERLDFQIHYVTNAPYISNPPGLYNLKAVFQPDPAVAQGKTLTASALIRVLDGPDSLELLKQKLTEKKK